MNSLIPQKYVDQFWSKVDQSKGPEACWPWLASHIGKGYGQCNTGKGQGYSHRYAWTLTYGEIPDKLFVLHKCDNPTCCNPAHLWLGTCKDNLQDCSRKKRFFAQLHPDKMPRGASHGRTKLAEEDVREIRKWISGGMRVTETADAFGVSSAAVSLIISGKNWGWLK